MPEKALTAQTISNLARKLDEFSEVLTPDEHAVLLGLIGTAEAAMQSSHAEAETEGMTTDRAILNRPTNVVLPKLSDAIGSTFKNVPGLGDGVGPVSDSVGVGWLCVSWSKDYNKLQPDESILQPQAMRLPGMKVYR